MTILAIYTSKDSAELFLTEQIDHYGLNENSPDLHILETADKSIKIDQIRTFCKKLHLKAFSNHTRLVIIKEAHKLTIPSQNSLLKFLEEPPTDTVIILTTEHADKLIPTIHSRCRKTYIDPNESNNHNTQLNADDKEVVLDFLNGNFETRLYIVSSINSSKDTQPQIDFLTNLEKYFHNLSKKDTNLLSEPKTLLQIEQILKSTKRITQGANRKIALDNMIIQLDMID